MRILLTGGAGYIGSHTAVALAATGRLSTMTTTFGAHSA